MPELAEIDQEELLRQREEELRAEEERMRLASMQIQDAPPAELSQPPIMDAPAAGFIPPAPPVWAGSSTADIDAFNRDPGRMSPAPNATQYAQEVARAQRGSGFINAEVGPGGNVVTPGYDPEKIALSLNQRATKAATDFQRNQFYGSLLAGGATPAEAFRAANARFPQIQTPLEMEKLETLRNARNFQPRKVDVGGFPLLETRPGVFTQPRPPTAEKFTGGKVTPIAAAESGDIGKEIAVIRDDLSKGVDANGVPLSEEDKAAKEARIKALQQQRKDLLDRPEFSPAVDQKGWNAMRERFNAPEQPAPITAAPKQLTPDLARELLKSSGGDKAKARQMAKDAGYTF